MTNAAKMLQIFLSGCSASSSVRDQSALFAIIELICPYSILTGINFRFCAHRFEASTLLSESGVIPEPFIFTDHG